MADSVMKFWLVRIIPKVCLGIAGNKLKVIVAISVRIRRLASAIMAMWAIGMEIALKEL